MMTKPWLVRGLLGLLLVAWCSEVHAAPAQRRILYNLDGDSCMTLKAGRKGPGPIDTADLRRIVEELTAKGSQVDTLLVCINAQVLYFPTRVGTLRGTLSTPEEREKWPEGERQRFRNLQSFFDQGIDPYAVILAEARKKGLEALLTFRMNDAHGNDFLRTAFWLDHPDFRLGNGALDFGQKLVRDYVFELIREAVQRYDSDGIELDFQRFPTYFKTGTVEERIAQMNPLVERVRVLLDDEGKKRGRRLVLGVRAPSNYGRTPPSESVSRQIGCDPVGWAQRGWIDFLTVSEFLFERYDLAIRPWKRLLPDLPVYGSIECTEGGTLEQNLTATKYRRAARHLWKDGADGIYLFNFFTTRENGAEAFEPPFEVMHQLGSTQTLEKFPGPPWETNRSLITVKRQLYEKHPQPRTAAMVAVQSVGPRLELREWRARESVSDVADRQQARWSTDNGRTWSPWIGQAPSSLVDYGTTKATETGWGDVFDPASKRLIQTWLRQIEIKGVFYNASFLRASEDQGRTWSEPSALRYESGPEFDPKNPLLSDYLQRNNGYPGNQILIRRDGSLVLCLAHANAAHDPGNDRRPWRMGTVLFLGRWNVQKTAYEWTPGARTEIEPERSARGLMEPEVAELTDGRLLVVWRGSNTGWDGSVAKEPGRKWFAISADGGRSLSAVQEWKYADGGSFYSPSSIHRMIRHTVTGKLYWIGNICLEPPDGNLPRYPLLLAEVDETQAALRRETLSVIEDRYAFQGPSVQFSNFSLYENRETHDLELYLTTYGQEPDPQDWATADCYHYTVRLR